jgi:ubiquinone/menaquinone biosynthesis C-methylase UbiE
VALNETMNAAMLLLNRLARLRAFLKITVPTPLRSHVLDTLELFSGTRNQVLPPLKLRHRIGQDEAYSGDVHVASLRELCQLKPTERILDVGSGTGRIALSLTKYMNADGAYDGLEIVKEFVDWCQQNITRKYPNFHFTRADVFSGSYNPNGTFKASEYEFPFADASFDVVFLSSVFTHMLPRDLENYLREIARVLKKNGRCWISFYLVDTERTKQVNPDKIKMKFLDFGEFYTADKEVPENAIGYKVDYVLRQFKENGLEVVLPIHYGNWSGIESETGLQDIIVAKKKL